MNHDYSAFLVALSICAFAASGERAIAGELDGKMATCSFAEQDSFKGKEFFLKFEQNKVTQMEIVASKAKNSDYGFEYVDVKLKEEVKPVYVKPISIFWGQFAGAVHEVKSRDDIGLFAMLGGVGIWVQIDRSTLDAEYGIIMSGQAFAFPGKCQLSDKSGHDAFIDKYQTIKSNSDSDFNLKLEKAKEVEEARSKENKL